MTPDLLPAAGFAVFLFCFVAVVSFASRQRQPRKEPAMHPEPAAPVTRTARDIMHPVRDDLDFGLGVAPDDAPTVVGAPVDPDAHALYRARQRREARRATRAASPWSAEAIESRREAIAAQDVIAWRDMTDAELEIFCKWPKAAGSTVAKRARLAKWKRARRAAMRGGGK